MCLGAVAAQQGVRPAHGPRGGMPVAHSGAGRGETAPRPYPFGMGRNEPPYMGSSIRSP